MKKILIFSPYYKSHMGGLESLVEDLNKELLKNISDLEIVIITSLIPNNQNKVEIYSRFKIVRLPFFEIINNFPFPKFWDKDFKKKYKKISSKDYDLVISHTRFFLTSLMASLFSKKKKTKWIHVEHGSDFVQTKNLFVKFWAYVYDISIGRLVLKKADEVISVSEAVSRFVTVLANRKSVVIYRGFNASQYKNVPESKLIAKKYNKFTKIVFIGRLISGKGVNDLLCALEKLNKNKQWVLLIVGDGDCKKDLVHSSILKGIKNRVVFLNQLDHKNTLEVLKSGDLFINPSYTEGLPTTVIEAISLKKPVIATDVGGTNECFYKKVSLINPGDIKELSRKIKNFLDTKKIGYDLEKNYQYILKKFNWDKSISFVKGVLDGK